MKTTSCGTAAIRVGASGEYEVLLVRPRAAQDVWGYPKGHCLEGEEHLACAARETLEETGVDVFVLPELLGSGKVQTGKEKKTVHIFLAYPVSGMNDVEGTEPVPQDEENYQVAWFPITSLPACHKYQQPMFDGLAVAVDRVFQKQG